MKHPVLIILVFFIMPLQLLAADVDVMDVRVEKINTTHYKFDVTLRHADTGWDHYADKWEILGPDGKIYGTRVLFHPHVDEQPFTRSLDDVAIPADVTEVTIRGGAKPHGYGGQTKTIKLPK